LFRAVRAQSAGGPTTARECGVVGRLLGEKLVLTEFIAYVHLGEILHGASSEVVDLYAIGFDPVWRSERDAPNWMDESIPQEFLDRVDLRQELLDGAKNPIERFLPQSRPRWRRRA
jgi:hypothetical protein